MKTKAGIFAPVAALSLLFLAACSSSGSSAGSSASGAGSTSAPAASSASSAGSATSLNHLLPADIRASGVITVGTSADYPPYEFLAADGKTIQGADPDLAAAVGKLLGVRFQFTNVPFSSAFTGLQAGRYDIIWSDAGDYKVREKTFDILDYNKTGQNFLFRSNGPHINTLMQACGLTVAVDQGSASIGFVQGVSKQCTAAHHAAVHLETFPSQNAAVLAVQSGRADATSNDSETNGFVAVRSNGQLLSGGPAYVSGVDGIDFIKGSPLLAAVHDALTELSSNGTYQAIFKKWGITANEIPAFTVNGGLS
jgi:polar amino acid transport system substrate-binding protein